MIARDEPPRALSLALERGVTNPPGKSFLHGELHWKCVALTGLEITRWMPGSGADAEFIFTFALLHDLMRENDDDDPAHGLRASHLFAQLVIDPGIAGFDPYNPRTGDMCYALAHHNDTQNARACSNPNVGICWDADRLLLPRVGITPEDQYLTTKVGRGDVMSLYGLMLCHKQQHGVTFPSWSEIIRWYEEARR